MAGEPAIPERYRRGMRYEVTEADTAAAVGSGEVAVLATPRLLAWLEAATLQAVAPLVSAERTTVGTAVRVKHRRPSPVGAPVEVTAHAPDSVDDHRVTCSVWAVDEHGTVLADGEIDRAIVDRSQFPAP